MISRLIGRVRQAFRKTILTFRTRREEFLSKFRFSIGFRISFHYFFVLVLVGILVFVPIFFFFYQTDLPKYEVAYRYKEWRFDFTFGHMLWAVVGLYGFISLIVIKSGQKGIKKLFQPIESMSATVNRLTVNNLNSARLNVEGTMNELKDLAMTFNKMLERLEVSYESQRQFVSDASHELRTPIAVIQGYANLLDRWGKNDEAVMEESIQAIKNEANEMQELVEKLLFLSRHDKKTLKLTKTKFNMCEVVEEMVKETKLVTAHRDIEAPILENVVVYGDKQALKQAIRVFIDNGIKYTKEGGILHISCRNINGDCVITIEDNGIGMSRKDMDNIFQRFYRSDLVRNEKISGHGLGLSIAKLIILKHSGRIKVRSQYKKGSVFTITIPRGKDS